MGELIKAGKYNWQAFGGGDPDDDILELMEIVDFIKMMEPDSDEDDIKKRVKNSLKKMGVGEELKLEEFEKAIEGVIPNLDAALSIHFGLRGDEPDGGCDFEKHRFRSHDRNVSHISGEKYRK